MDDPLCNLWLPPVWKTNKQTVAEVVPRSRSVKVRFSCLLHKKLSQQIKSKINTSKSISTDLKLDEKLTQQNNRSRYQPCGAGGTCSLPATPHSLDHLTASLIQNGQRGLEIGQTLKIQNGCQWTPKWLTGSGKRSSPRFLGAPKISFLIRALLLLWEK